MHPFARAARRIVLTGLTAVALGAALLGTASAPATAAASRQLPSDAVAGVVCQQYTGGYGDLCLWRFNGASGSRAAFYSDDPYLWDNVFVTPGAGQGETVADNAGSYFNMDTKWAAVMCTGANYTGSCRTFAPNTAGNLPPGYVNNVESLYWFCWDPKKGC
jgi:peptidase inhibitor family I36